jgi:hypothetical protein
MKKLTLFSLLLLCACASATTAEQRAQQDRLMRDAAAQADPNPARDELERINRELR